MEGEHQPRNVLMVGEGPGRFLREFRRKYPEARITVVEGSARMVEIARRRMPEGDQTLFIHSMISDWDTDERFDLIVTNFLLDCLSAAEVEEIVKKLAYTTTSGAEWWIAEFDVPDSIFGKWRSRLIIKLLYGFFEWVAGVKAKNIHSPAEALHKEGFILAARQTFSWGLLKGERWSRRC